MRALKITFSSEFIKDTLESMRERLIDYTDRVWLSSTIQSLLHEREELQAENSLLAAACKDLRTNAYSVVHEKVATTAGELDFLEQCLENEIINGDDLVKFLQVDTTSDSQWIDSVNHFAPVKFTSPISASDLVRVEVDRGDGFKGLSSWISPSKSCECGATKCGHLIHSSWCPAGVDV